ncbi:MAG: DUF2169 domain-containing protein, partial [Polyangiaceae bacterium]
NRRLQAGETLNLLGVTPERLLRFQLPAWPLTIRAFRDQGPTELRRPAPDTVIVQPENSRVEMVLRERYRLLRSNPLRELQVDAVAA